VKSPRPPLFERGETSLARHFLQLPPFAKVDGGGFSCVGATNIQVMSVYEAVNLKSAGRHASMIRFKLYNSLIYPGISGQEIL
jgi:hypothetical protein